MKKTIITVTLNPALDKTVNVNKMVVGGLNRVADIRVDAGGKGINVAKVLQSFGEEVVTTGFVGGHNGAMLLHEMETLHIKHSFISIHEETRTNLKIVDQSTKETTEVNEAGGEVQASELKAFYELFDQLLQDAAVLVLAGSLSPGLSIDIYEQLLQMAHGQGVLSILDAEGESFLHGLKAHPTVIKPNIHELEGLLNRQLHHDSEIVNACQELIDTYKLDAVIVSMGKDGSIFVNKSETLRVTPFPIEPKSTVGAGDSMVAAIASSLVHQRSFKDMARYACAAGTITASKSGTDVATVQEVEQKLDQVGITRLS